MDRQLARVTPLTGLAARLAADMTESLSVPTATSVRDVPVRALEAQHRALKSRVASMKISLTQLIAYALIQAAKLHPVMTHSFALVDGGPHRVDAEAVHLGIWVDVARHGEPHQLLLPVIRDAADMDFGTFASALESAVRRARAEELNNDDLTGGTTSLSNTGMIGTYASFPRLMAGQGSVIAPARFTRESA